jgi:transposase
MELDPARVRDEHRHLYPDARACRCCGAALVEIGEETRVVIEHEPARFRRVTTHRHKMACAACKHGGVVIAQPDDPPASGPGMVGLSLAIEIALRHYADHLPFHRIAGIFERDGLRINRATLSRVGGRVADALARLVGCMEAELLESDDVLGIDGTGIKILARRATSRPWRGGSGPSARASPWRRAWPSCSSRCARRSGRRAPVGFALSAG